LTGQCGFNPDSLAENEKSSERKLSVAIQAQPAADPPLAEMGLYL